MTKRRVEISFERERLLIVSRRRVSITAWCEGCGARSRMMTPEGAAELSGDSARDVYRRVEAGEVHFTETEDGKLLVCCNCLKATTRI